MTAVTVPIEWLNKLIELAKLAEKENKNHIPYQNYMDDIIHSKNTSLVAFAKTAEVFTNKEYNS
jgi:hypothetical protein